MAGSTWQVREPRPYSLAAEGVRRSPVRGDEEGDKLKEAAP